MTSSPGASSSATAGFVPYFAAFDSRLPRQRLSAVGRANTGAAVPRHLDLRAELRVLALQLRDQGADVDGLQRLIVVHAAEQVQRTRDHALHLVEIGVEPLAQRRVVERFGAQLQARQRRAQIVRHRRQHARAAIEIPMQTLLHRVERARGLAQLARTGFAQRHARAAADSFCCGRELGQRPRDRARHHEQNDTEHERHEAELEQQRQRQRRRRLRCIRAERDGGAVRQRDRDVELARRAAGTAGAGRALARRARSGPPGRTRPARRRRPGAEPLAPAADTDDVGRPGPAPARLARR